jgi:RNA polymerase sigma factor (sigma-70 family)
MNNIPELAALQRNDSVAWDQLFDWLYPVAYSVAEFKLKNILPTIIEDVAVEAIEKLVPKIDIVLTVEELRPLVACIAACNAKDHIRKHFSEKYGGGQVESLDIGIDGEADSSGHPKSKDDIDEAIRCNELAQLMIRLMANLKPKSRALLTDFFLDGKKYEELSASHGLAINSIGVYLKRALTSLHDEVQKRPQLGGELRLLLSLPLRACSFVLCVI